MNNLRFNLLFIFAGGPAASLLFALISLLCLLSADGSRSGSFIYSFGLFSGLSFLFFVTNLWPMQVGWFHTDGLLLLTLLRRGADADVIYAQYRWACVAYSEVRPCDWDVSWVSATSTHGQPAPFELLGSMVAYAHAIDSGNIADAGAYLDRAGVAVKQVPIQLTITFFLESAYFEARHRGNAVQARQSFDQAPDLAHAIERYTMLRCESAVLLVEGRGDDAARLIAEARTILDSAAVNGDVLAERDLVLDLEMQLKS
jgi:hypothetical protein